MTERYTAIITPVIFNFVFVNYQPHVLSCCFNTESYLILLVANFNNLLLPTCMSSVVNVNILR